MEFGLAAKAQVEVAMVDAEHEYASVRHRSSVTLIPPLTDQKIDSRANNMKHL